MSEKRFEFEFNFAYLLSTKSVMTITSVELSSLITSVAPRTIVLEGEVQGLSTTLYIIKKGDELKFP